MNGSPSRSLQLRNATRRLGQRCWGTTIAVAVSAPFLAATATTAQQYDSGSSGIHGVFPPVPVGEIQIPTPSSNMTVLWNMSTGLVRYCSSYDTLTREEVCITQISNAQIPSLPSEGLETGVFEFSDFVLPSLPADGGFRYTLIPVGDVHNVPLTVLSQNDIFIGRGWTLAMEGLSGEPSSLPPLGGTGGLGGPGGFDGGAGGNGGDLPIPFGGSAGFGPNGGAGGMHSTSDGALFRGANAAASLASPSTFLPVGGSGGGGGAGVEPDNSLGCGSNAPGNGGGGGGGGGGSLLLAANDTITIGEAGGAFFTMYAEINLNGGLGAGNLSLPLCGFLSGGAGTGGSLRLVASRIASPPHPSNGGALLNLNGGSPQFGGGNAPGGRFRLEAWVNDFAGLISGAGGGSSLAFPTAAIPTPFPTLQITSIGGIAVSQTKGELADPDVSFPAPPANPVTVNLAASGIPLGTTIDLRLAPGLGTAETATSTGLAGSQASSTASASIDIPPGFGLLTAAASFLATEPAMAALGLRDVPTLDGEKPDHIEVVAAPGSASRVFMVTRSGARLEVGAGSSQGR